MLLFWQRGRSCCCFANARSSSNKNKSQKKRLRFHFVVITLVEYLLEQFKVLHISERSIRDRINATLRVKASLTSIRNSKSYRTGNQKSKLLLLLFLLLFPTDFDAFWMKSTVNDTLQSKRIPVLVAIRLQRVVLAQILMILKYIICITPTSTPNRIIPSEYNELRQGKASRSSQDHNKEVCQRNKRFMQCTRQDQTISVTCSIYYGVLLVVLGCFKINFLFYQSFY